VTKLLGDKPNQAPTNADLGDLAYQDGANCQIGPIEVTGGDVAIDTDTLFVDATNDRLGIGTSSPTQKLDVNADSIRVRTAQTPATAGAAGNQGEIAWDADYIYICTATDTWKRVAIATW